MPLVCVSGTKLSVMIATKNEEHTIGPDKDGVVTPGRNSIDVFFVSAFDDGWPEYSLCSVTKPQLSVVVAAEPKDMLLSRENDRVIVPAAYMPDLGAIELSFHSHELSLGLCRFQPELPVVVLSA